MLTIQTTPSLYGISLIGDYQDLNSLYDSISRYLSFYRIRVFEDFPEHEYEYLLSLNYDIRHAYMGTRNIEIIENNADNVGIQAEAFYQIPDKMKKEFQKTRQDYKNGNLYFSVNILYPLIFHYLIAFEFILEDEPEESCFGEKEDSSIEGYWIKDYTYIDAQADRMQIRLFTALLWKNLQELLGKEKSFLIYDYFSGLDPYVPHSLYCDAIIHSQGNYFRNINQEQKQAFLELSIYEMMGSEDLKNYQKLFEDQQDCYQKDLDVIKSLSKSPLFPLEQDFYNRLDKAFPPGQPLYEEAFEDFLKENYGPCDIEEDFEW